MCDHRLQVLCWLTACTASMVWLGCHPRGIPQSEPIEVAQKYALALKNRDFSEAAKLLEAEQRDRLGGENGLILHFRHNDRDRDAAIDSIIRGEMDEENRQVSFRTSTGSQLALVARDSSWFVSSGDLVPVPDDNPETALKNFLVAIESGDCETIAGFAPPRVLRTATRRRLVDACRAKLDELRTLAKSVRDSGSRLLPHANGSFVLSHGTYRSVIVVRQNGSWFIEDL